MYKKRNKVLFTLNIIITTALTIALLCSCANNKNVTGDTRTVTDCMERTVQIPKDPQRIACLYAFIGHTAGMLDSMDKTVAIVDGLKRDHLITRMFPQVLNLSAPFGEGNINFEELLAQQPDLIFVRGETASNEDQREKLDSLGIPWLMIDYTDIAGQRRAVQVMGDALQQQAEAARYDAYYEKCLTLVKKRTQDIPFEEKVKVYHSVNEATRTDPAGSISAEIIEAAGGVDISAKQQLKLLENKYYASLEQIYTWNPDVMLVNETGVPEYIMSNPKWSGLRAVQEKKVIQMPVGISRWGHPGSLETPLALLWTGKTLYPKLFTDVDMIKETSYFYQDFFETKLSADEIEQMLDGQGMRENKE